VYSMEVADVENGVRAFAQKSPFSLPLSDTGSKQGAGSPGFRTQALQNRVIQAFVEVLRKALGRLVIRISPHRNPALKRAVSGKEALTDEGLNLANWMDYAQENERRIYNQVVNEFKRVLPEASEVETPRV